MFKYTLHDDEQLLQVYRKHEVTLTGKVFQIFLLVFIPWFFGIKYDFIFSTPTHAKLFVAWTLLVGLYAVYVFLVWSLNVYIMTTKRMIHISHTGLFKKDVKETPVDRILNVSFRTKGIFSTLFNFGDVLVQVVGLDQPLVLLNVPNPSEVKDFIWKIHLESEGEQKLTYTTPEIAPADKVIPYAPNVPEKKLVKKRKTL